jgi:hypothetical protein
MAERKRCYIQAHGQDDDAVRRGLVWLMQEAKDVGGGTLHVPGLDSLGSLSHIISNIDAIAKSKSFNLNGVRIGIATLRTGDVRGAVLALWTDDRTLEGIEDRSMPPTICAIPWNGKDIDKWVAAFGPTELRTGATPDTTTVSNPVVVEAMKSLTSSVNLSTGLGHPSDHDAAVWTFRALKEAGEALLPEEVRAWAAAHNWRLKDATELAEIAQKVIDGKRIKTRSRHWKPEIVDYWRERSGSG